MDIQLTDFENVALTICTGMIANIANTFDLDFILPISLVDENMKRAHNRNGLLETKFWWKLPDVHEEPQATREACLQATHFLHSSHEDSAEESKSDEEEEAKLEQSRYKELYVWQILNGDESVGLSKGLIKLCEEYMALKNWPEEQVAETNYYLRFLSDRALGKVPTGASFLREYVMNHPAYAKDSKLNDQINFDVLKMMSDLNEPDSEHRQHLLGEYA